MELQLGFSIWFEDDEEELTPDEEDDFAELEDATELELATELLNPSTSVLPPLRACPEPVEGMTLEEEEPSNCSGSLTLEELTGSSVVAEDDESDGADDEVIKAEDDEAVKIEEDDSSAGFSSPDEPFAEVQSSQAARPKTSANAQVPRARKFFFMRDL